MREAILRAHVWLVAIVLPLLVRFVPIRGLLVLVEQPRWWDPYRGIAPERIVEIVDRRLQNPHNMRRRRCLRQGLTLFHFLRLAAVPSVLNFGVLGPATAGKRLHAHCWVTISGRDLYAPQHPFVVLLTREYQPSSG